MDRRSWIAGAVGALLCLAPAALQAEIKPEALHQYTVLDQPTEHWAFYLDLNQLDISKARLVLFDADTAEFKTHIAAGQFPTLHFSADGSQAYVVDSWLHGPRQTREDYVTVYDTKDYSISHVIELPGRRRALMAPRYRTALVADRFLAIFNFTPGTSVTVVDLETRSIIGTTPTPGCSLVYPTGQRSVSMICGDGSLLTLAIDEAGKVSSQHRSEPFFDPDVDPIMENGASQNGVWYFPSYGGDVYPVDLRGEVPLFPGHWPLVDHSVQPAGLLATIFTLGKAGPWLPGGFSPAAVHETRGELYVLTHPVTWSEGKGDHVFPGPEVWVYDLKSQKRTRRITLRGVGISVFVTPDPNPLLLVGGADIETEALRLEVYDAKTGDFLREMTQHGDAPLQFQGVDGR